MNTFEKYFSDTYEMVDLIKSSEENFVSIVYDKNSKRLCVMKERNLKLLEIYQTLQQINNIYIPQIYRLIERDGKLIVIEEHIEGETLEEILNYQSNRIDEKLSLKILLQICDCLKVLHSEDIIHRDIKPANIMLTKDNLVKFIDFGIARKFKKDNSADTEFLGTRGYAAPEQYGLFGLGQTDARTDIHLLGITIKELLGNDYNGWLLKILNRCTILDPSNRYQSVAELIQDIKYSRKIFWLKRFSLIAAIILAAVAIPKQIDIGNLEEVNQTITEEVTPQEKIIEESKNEEIIKNSPFNEDAQKLIEFTTPIDIKSSNELPEIKMLAVNEPAQNKNNEKRPRLTLYINGRISKNRGPHTTAGDFILSDDGWKNWHKTSKGDILYPENWTAQLKIENLTNRDIINPRITFEARYDPKKFSVDKPTIKSGQTITVDLPIANRVALRFLGPNHYSGELTVGFISSSEEYKSLLIRDVKIKKFTE